MKGMAKEMKYITFALAKGRLAKQTLGLLEQIGITCEEMKDEKTRKLIFVNEELGFKFFYQKQQMFQLMWKWVLLILEW